jgi:hypothetical protein
MPYSNQRLIENNRVKTIGQLNESLEDGVDSIRQYINISSSTMSIIESNNLDQTF